MVLPVKVSAAVCVSIPLVLCAARAVRVESEGCNPVVAIVTVSVLAFVVIAMPVPAASVRISVVESATTSGCPETAIV